MKIVIFIFSIYVLFAKHLDCLRFSSPFDYSTSEAITDIAYVIASGYIVSYIFYIITVYIPYKRKSQIVRRHLAEELRYLKDSFDAAFENIVEEKWNKSNKFPEEFYNRFWIVPDKREMNPKTQRYMYEHIDIIDKHIHDILSNVEYLTNSEADTLYKVLHSYSFSQIRCRFDKDEIYDSKPNAITIISGLQTVYNDINRLYSDMGIKTDYLKKQNNNRQ